MIKHHIVLIVAGVIFITITMLCYEARYPAVYSQIKKGMTEEEVTRVLRNNGFVLTPTFGRFKDVWVRKQMLGEWVFSCSYDTNTIWHLSVWYHVSNCGEYVRARNRDFEFE
jgi:hypothetical protein